MQSISVLLFVNVSDSDDKKKMEIINEPGMT